MGRGRKHDLGALRKATAWLVHKKLEKAKHDPEEFKFESFIAEVSKETGVHSRTLYRYEEILERFFKQFSLGSEENLFDPKLPHDVKTALLDGISDALGNGLDGVTPDKWK